MGIVLVHGNKYDEGGVNIKYKVVRQHYLPIELQGYSNNYRPSQMLSKQSCKHLLIQIHSYHASNIP